MLLLVVVIAVLGAGFLFLMFGTNFGKDPSKKPLPHLRRAAEIHARRMRGLDLTHPKYQEWRAEMQQVDDEIEKREAMRGPGDSRRDEYSLTSDRSGSPRRGSGGVRRRAAQSEGVGERRTDGA